MIPESVRRRLAVDDVVRPRADRAIAAGDIRRAESGGVERLVLVLKVNSARENAQVALIHSYPEYATDGDLIVDQKVSGVSYPIVVETGMRGIVWLTDLRRLVTGLPTEVVAACLGPRLVTPAIPGISVGTAYMGPLEARADFKGSERNSLAQLCADCTAAVLEGGTFQFEVDEVFSALLAPSPHADLMMQSIIKLWKTRGDDLIFTLEHVEVLESKGLLAVERWESSLGVEGLAFRLGPLQHFIERAMTWFGQDEPRPTATIGEKQLVDAGRSR